MTVKISGDYDISNADLKEGTYIVDGRAWKVSKAHPRDKRSTAVASTVVNGAAVKLEIPDEWRMGSLSVGRTVVEGLILNTEDIEDPQVRSLAEDGYRAMRACLGAAIVAKAALRKAEVDAEQDRQAREKAKRAAAIARLR